MTRRLLESYAHRLPASGAADPPPRERLAQLTARELEVLELVARGLSNAEIAERFVLSEATVKTHVGRILAKLELRDRVQIVVFAYENGLDQPVARLSGRPRPGLLSYASVSVAISLLVLVAALAAAVARRPRMPGPAVAAAGALVLLAAGLVGAHQAGHAIRELAPTIGFLAALLVLADGCRREGLFDALGAVLAHRSRGDQRRLLALVFAAASAVTILLGLDATVVLLTPVVLVCAHRLRAQPRAPSYACVHLANSASLLLPVSNLTNLLAFRASGLSFARFGALMLLPTIWAVAVDWVALRRLAPRGDPAPATAATGPDAGHPKGVPGFALAVLALTLAGFLASSLLDVAPVWIATGGAVLITLPALRAPGRTARELAGAVQPGSSCSCSAWR